MKLEVRRKWFTDRSTIGELFINGVRECFTLEDCMRERLDQSVTQWKVPGATAIPTGQYKLIIDKSTRFKRWMPHILCVPGFDGIRMHSGNTDADTEGCILLGTMRELNAVYGSRVAYAAFIQKIAVHTGEVDEQGDGIWKLLEPCEIVIVNQDIAPDVTGEISMVREQ